MIWLPFLPNALTLSRLLLCPLIVGCEVVGWYGWGAGLFGLAILSDFLDGYLARRLGVESELGTLLDPICDKLLALSFFTFLMTQGSCPPWFLGLLLAIVLLQSSGFLMVHFSRLSTRSPLRPLTAGKWNMAVQFAWIGVLFMDILLRHRFPRTFRYSEVFHQVGYGALAALQVAVFFRYFLRFRRFLIPDLRFTRV